MLPPTHAAAASVWAVRISRRISNMASPLKYSQKCRLTAASDSTLLAITDSPCHEASKAESSLIWLKGNSARNQLQVALQSLRGQFSTCRAHHNTLAVNKNRLRRAGNTIADRR